jgi:hypothetical protein
MKDQHNCFYFKGKIKDVTFNKKDKIIKCRRCEAQLEEGEIDPQTYGEISKIIFKKKEKRNDRNSKE